eukprot:TRINITY_DN21687_c0_g1_i13.p1 TRINITY_DN21687_c0_g1~~TRINITY_DN21687_c0_g1_i13.p1  ORF type:complete len:598 (-),score=69.12 TRINITY_DN21687_c0_g1_i13:65-1858(-)
MRLCAAVLVSCLSTSLCAVAEDAGFEHNISGVRCEGIRTRADCRGHCGWNSNSCVDISAVEIQSSQYERPVWILARFTVILSICTILWCCCFVPCAACVLQHRELNKDADDEQQKAPSGRDTAIFTEFSDEKREDAWRDYTPRLQYAHRPPDPEKIVSYVSSRRKFAVKLAMFWLLVCRMGMTFGLAAQNYMELRAWERYAAEYPLIYETYCMKAKQQSRSSCHAVIAKGRERFGGFELWDVSASSARWIVFTKIGNIVTVFLTFFQEGPKTFLRIVTFFLSYYRKGVKFPCNLTYDLGGRLLQGQGMKRMAGMSALKGLCFISPAQMMLWWRYEVQPRLMGVFADVQRRELRHGYWVDFWGGLFLAVLPFFLIYAGYNALIVSLSEMQDILEGKVSFDLFRVLKLVALVNALVSIHDIDIIANTRLDLLLFSKCDARYTARSLQSQRLVRHAIVVEIARAFRSFQDFEVELKRQAALESDVEARRALRGAVVVNASAFKAFVLVTTFSSYDMQTLLVDDTQPLLAKFSEKYCTDRCCSTVQGGDLERPSTTSEKPSTSSVRTSRPDTGTCMELELFQLHAKLVDVLKGFGYWVGAR